jgi:aarF domain-containing kinase
VLINALNTWFGSVVGCETFHADVHAGNLLVLPDGRVGFIDFGIVGSIRWGKGSW